MPIYLYVSADSLQTPLRWSLRAGEEQRLLDLVKQLCESRTLSAARRCIFKKQHQPESMRLSAPQVRCLARDVNLPEQEVLGILQMTHIPPDFAVALTLGAGCLSGGINQAKALLREHTSTQLSRVCPWSLPCMHHTLDYT